MSEQDTQPEATQDVTEDTTDATTEQAPEADEDAETDWRKNFDPDKAAARIAKIQSENKNLRDRAKQAEDKAKGVDERDQTITALQAQNLRYEVAFDLGLPRELADRLKGNTKDEMLADAEALVKLVGGPKPAVSRKPAEALRGGGGSAGDAEPVETDLRKIGERMFNR